MINIAGRKKHICVYPKYKGNGSLDKKKYPWVE
jgi:hypothetical protein